MKSHRLLRADAARIWTAALGAVDPEASIRRRLKRNGRILSINGSRWDLSRYRHVWVLGAGKAASSMGHAVEKILGRYLAGGLLVTKYGHSSPLKKLPVIEAGHPLPDENSLAAARQIGAFSEMHIRPDDFVLCVFSGGASSLLVLPAPGITLQDKLISTQLLLNSGADIYELNAIRKHLSAIKGGGLARMLHPAKVVSLMLSDVVGDDVATIASGPTAPDPTTFGNCMEILQKLHLMELFPSEVRTRFERGSIASIPETPKGGDPVFLNTENLVVASNAQACSAAAGAAKRLGYRTLVLTSSLEGDTAAAAGMHMSIAGEVIRQLRPVRPPACIISGGETTVKVTGSGMGGRNQEFAMQCVRQLAHFTAPCVVVSLGTDGTDGPTDAAGAIADNLTLSRSMKFGARFLDETMAGNDSYHFFQRLGDLIVTGPTHTNVMDLHLVLVGASDS
jgi:glycerate 2-kinase